MNKFESFKKLIQRKRDARFRLLKREIRHMRDNIEKMLNMFFESSASRAQVNYSGLEMY